MSILPLICMLAFPLAAREPISSGPETAPVEREGGDIDIETVSPDGRAFYDYAFRLGPKPNEDAIGRIVKRAATNPDDAEALYWAARIKLDRLSADPAIDGKRCLLRAVELGYMPAIAAHGVALGAGELGFDRDPEKAVELLEQAAELGEPTAFFYLGMMRITGVGLDADPREAVRLMTQAEAAGITASYPKLARLYIQQLGQRATGFEYFAKYAEKSGNLEIIELLYRYYAGLLGDPDDPREAASWLKRGAEAGEPKLILTYVKALESGYGGLAPNPPEARRLVESLAERNPSARAMIAYGHVTGAYGIAPANPARGIAKLEALRAEGEPEAQYQLGRLLLKGRHVQRDQDRAVQLLEAASKQGHLDAKEILRLRRHRLGASEQAR